MVVVSDIGTPQKNEYYLCAETPGAARAWVSTLHQYLHSIFSAACAYAVEQTWFLLLDMLLICLVDVETLRVKDEELQNLSRELRLRDSTIKELAEKLFETAQAAEAAAYAMDGQRKIVCTEIERLKKDSEQQLESSMSKLRASGEKFSGLLKEREQLLQQRDSALKEAQLWRTELGKAREQVVILEGAVVRAEERARLADVDAEARANDAMEKQLSALKEKRRSSCICSNVASHLTWTCLLSCL